MSERTGIAWADSTWNPWHGCVKVSQGCKHCYAETWRFRRAEWGPTAARVKTSKAYWREPVKWNKEEWMECQSCGWRGTPPPTPPHRKSSDGEGGRCPKCEERLTVARRRVFASMCDPFEDNRQVANWRGEWFRLIEQTPNIDWLLLTKRPERMFSLGTDAAGVIFDLWLADYQNVWLGTSIESQDYFDERVGALVNYGIQARVLFLSVEPMIAPVRLTPVPSFSARYWDFTPGKKSHISWVICGGESGRKSRPMEAQWARDLRDDCRTHGVKFFMKQMGGFPDKRDGWEDLPEDLRVRETPTPSGAIAPPPPNEERHLEEGG